MNRTQTQAIYAERAADLRFALDTVSMLPASSLEDLYAQAQTLLGKGSGTDYVKRMHIRYACAYVWTKRCNA
jgi:hypothetical protein